MRNSVQILIATILIAGILGLASLFQRGSSPPPAVAVVPQTPASTGAAPPPLRPSVSPAAPSHEQHAPVGASPATAQGAAPAVAQAPAAAQTKPPAGTQAVTADLAAGRQVYRKCQSCHALEPGQNRLGPTLAGVIGRKAGAETGFSYSTAMKNSGLTWDAATLDAYLADPQKVIPGNKMPFPGLKTQNERREVIAYLAAAISGPPANAPVANAPQQPPSRPVAAQAPQQPSVKYIPDVRYTLRASTVDGRATYTGVGGTIEGTVNPNLAAVEGQVVQVTLISSDENEHDIVFPEQSTRSPRIFGRGASTSIAFRAATAGEFGYGSSVPAGATGPGGKFSVTRLPPESIVQADISRDPADVPPFEPRSEPRTVRLDLVTVEQEARLADGTTYLFWTFNGRVPGPFVRVRVGDTIDVHVKNSADSVMIHSVDFHAATGPGGGAAALQVDPGAEKSMKWKALTPGLYVYHCATPMVAHHIASGMYGLILVEPEGGLPKVDREFYVMQGEVYTDAAYGQHGSQEFSVDKLLNERPEYFVFNGSVGAISQIHPLHAKVGETVRIFFGVGGPNYTSSFHVIGEIFDRVYPFADVITPPLQGVQTVTVPAGGATIVEFKLDVPGNYILVDHALARAERGLVGMLVVEGEPNPTIYDGVVTPGMGH